MSATTNARSTKVDDLRHKPPDYVFCELCFISAAGDL